MIEIFSCHTRFGLSPLDFVNMLYFLRKKGNKFMILEGKIGMLSATGIDIENKDIFKWISQNIIDYENKRVHDADIFIDDGDFMYIINHESTWKDGERLELGMITRNPKKVNNKLSKLANEIINAIKSTIDNRRIRYFDLNWYINGTSWEITSRRFPAGKFSESYLLDEEIKAAKLLENNSLKEFIYNIGKGKIYIPPIIDQELENDGILAKTIQNGLVSPAIQIICSKTSKALKTILTNNVHEIPKQIEGYCPKCNKPYSDEKLVSGYALTLLANKMKNGNLWMTITLTDALHRNGIPLDKIIWSLSEDSEEVDCVAEFKGKIWIFELKAKPFEAGNAHPFIYRAIKYKADKIVVITTDKVGPDAKKIFKDVSREFRAALDIDEVIYIEGLENMSSVISDMVKKEVRSQVEKKHKELKLRTSIEFYPVFNLLFGDYFKK